MLRCCSCCCCCASSPSTKYPPRWRSPLQGWCCRVMVLFPGRCPGLAWVALSGLVLHGVGFVPRAVPWAGMGRPFRAGVARGFGLMVPKAKDLLVTPMEVGAASPRFRCASISPTSPFLGGMFARRASTVGWPQRVEVFGPHTSLPHTLHSNSRWSWFACRLGACGWSQGRR